MTGIAKPPRRVLVIVTRRIGDVLLATPVFRSLKRAWPDTDIDALVFRSTAAVLSGNPDIHRVHAIEERPRLGAHFNFVAGLFRRYDLALSLVAGDRPTVYAWLAGRRRVGLLLPTRKESWKRRLLHQWVPYDLSEKHTVLTHLSALAPLHVPSLAEIVPPAPDQIRAAQALQPLGGRRYVVLHPYPRYNYKTWSSAGWIALAQWLDAQGFATVLTGGSDVAELAYVRSLARRMPGALNLAGELSLAATTGVIARAAAYVGPDTAATHIAAALGVPLVTFFGPTDPLKWGPWPRGHEAGTAPWQRLGDQARGNIRLLQGTAACAPCGHEGCDRHIGSMADCLQALPASRVIAALSEIVEVARIP